MRKNQKEQALNFIGTLFQLQEELIRNYENQEIESVLEKLTTCQESAIELGNYIERLEYEGHPVVSVLEKYCETVFNIYQAIAGQEEVSTHKLQKNLAQALTSIQNSVKNEVLVRKVAVFLPYKASMWDSLESVWEEAQADPDCDAYVIPIPYFDRNSDGTVKAEHYEADLFPPNVPITRYDQFDFSTQRPDMIFIHNPYDGSNFVTSVHPFFYSDNIKKYTDCLVYIPYFATAGGMSEGQSLCSAYLYADYIVIQSEKYRGFYDPIIPDEKFLPFGSPKFDSVIKKCQNPPEPSDEWKAIMIKNDGTKKKVYFYNTSIGGMLEDTESFLKKMEYVFDTFKGREDVCILWRPHPLLESTFDSMRQEFKPRFLELKKRFIEEKLGIFDTSPSMDDAIALSDVYIGDAASSLVGIFGVVGKAVFILNNKIHQLPSEEDIERSMWQIPYQAIDGTYYNQYYISPNNKLYYSENDDMKFRYHCDLSEYARDGYYSRAVHIGGYIYVLPTNAQHILKISKNKKITRIELDRGTELGGAFAGFWIWKNYIFLLPNRYPALVRLDTQTDEIVYIQGVGAFNVAEVNMERVLSARWITEDKMYFLNTEGSQLLTIHLDTLESEIMEVPINRLMMVATYEGKKTESIWLLPYEGTTVTYWNIKSGEIREYDLQITGLKAINRRTKREDNKRIFSSVAFVDDKVIFAPYWGNKGVELNPQTGEKKEWLLELDASADDKSAYFPNHYVALFVKDYKNLEHYQILYNPDRTTYEVDLRSHDVMKVEQFFDRQDILEHTNGYGADSEWLQYCCLESVYNSLQDELENTISGNAFDANAQLQAYRRVNASPQGDCGKKIYSYIKRL